MKFLHTIIGLSIVNLFFVGILVLLAKSPELAVQTNVQKALPTPNQVVTPAIVSPAKTTVPSVKQSNAVIPVTATSTPTPDNRCIIVISGVKYDVTDFRNLHSGGDIFQCGTDMTQVFFDRHDQSILDRMQKYRIS